MPNEMGKGLSMEHRHCHKHGCKGQMHKNGGKCNHGYGNNREEIKHLQNTPDSEQITTEADQ